MSLDSDILMTMWECHQIQHIGDGLSTGWIRSTTVRNDRKLWIDCTAKVLVLKHDEATFFKETLTKIRNSRKESL
ncbi:unnamed protein product [Gongylonema pulchrum]|uniref:PH domain-containing protein n=1 Tax=Gongylonema pulchrum TaxID=637853 RepID=A0A183D747_9BILA|nr:unnamed protein product [Gongylonema pulchrum]